ncbi:MAG TPA: glycoside hydrolase family 15 protein [Thermoplasmata archaeon]|nr:glycoside hydrolase family 15 protein [Thermoplasmata archaeon]
MITQLAGNGRVLLTVNESGEWNDLFYPYPGEFQHLRESRLGLFEPGPNRFSWLRPGNGFEGRAAPFGVENAPASEWTGHGLRIVVEDRVHPNHDLIIRTIRLRSETDRALRLFAYCSLRIAESMYQETAYVDTVREALIHYKRGFHFAFFSDPVFSHAVCGEHTLKGLQGTYVDAEDGRLDGRSVAHGAADSVIEWDLALAATEETTVRLFTALGTSRSAVHQVRDYVRTGGASRFEREASAFWQTWASRRLPRLPATLTDRVRELYRSSVLVMRHATGSNGSIIASPDTRSLVVGGDTYNYCWWRDGGYVAKAMDEAGLYENAQRFFEFARACQLPDGSFFHRHFPDGELGSTWHPPPFLQIDQTGTVLSALWHHFKRGSDPDVLLDFWPMVKAAANFLADFREPSTGLPRPSFDLWEERLGIHAYSAAAVAHGLERAGRIAVELGKDATRWRAAAREVREATVDRLWDPSLDRFVRSVEPRDDRIDASVLLAVKLGLLAPDDPRARRTVETIERRLWADPVGGVARFENDEYHGHENPWIISTLWLAECRLLLGDSPRCRELIEWVAAHATPTNLLPEQIDRKTGEPRSATPLTWSHSTFVDVVHKYQRALEPGAPDPE